MQLDVRLPIGIMFLIIGMILVGYGLITWTNVAMYQRSLGHNVNVWWGAVLLIIGLVYCLKFSPKRAA